MCLVPEETKVQVKRQFIIGIPPPSPPPRCLWDMPKLRKTIPDQVMVFTSQLTPHCRCNRAQPAGTSRPLRLPAPGTPPHRALHQLLQPSHGPACPGAAARPGQPRLSPSAPQPAGPGRAPEQVPGEGISSPATRGSAPERSCHYPAQRRARDRALPAYKYCGNLLTEPLSLM